ncbi:Acetyltransferase (GNAT) domain-containing protein [Chryseolinea serpens]|uniref:Acetyltransferase (GNAT) domain-containing protein n=1 Tax=Chryseolinea serpens TaxID=947013 RepID=A0A1M5MI99_9BACT|nr:GNAT family N-acetyltransferase [Chryseolinea serpens]SHG77154.1 Acetyltransferase (GNAT) domain-containing protein [Chryseolinea serpens]
MPFPAGSSLIRLSQDYQFKPFNCGDIDLNDFLLNDSKSYARKLLAVTYILENEAELIAFFSLLNDKITVQDVDSGNQWKKLFKLATGKSFNSHPAMKIGRLGVSNTFKGQGIGTIILDYIKELFITNNRTGCRYITVDAYGASLEFYKKNGFIFLTSKDKGQDTRLMYFDLMTLVEDFA